MPSGNDFLLRPVMRGLCSYPDLKSGILSIMDVAEMNDAIDVYDENERRLRKDG